MALQPRPYPPWGAPEVEQLNHVDGGEAHARVGAAGKSNNQHTTGKTRDTLTPIAPSPTDLATGECILDNEIVAGAHHQRRTIGEGMHTGQRNRWTCATSGPQWET